MNLFETCQLVDDNKVFRWMCPKEGSIQLEMLFYWYNKINQCDGYHSISLQYLYNTWTWDTWKIMQKLQQLPVSMKKLDKFLSHWSRRERFIDKDLRMESIISEVFDAFKKRCLQINQMVNIRIFYLLLCLALTLFSYRSTDKDFFLVFFLTHPKNN